MKNKQLVVVAQIKANFGIWLEGKKEDYFYETYGQTMDTILDRAAKALSKDGMPIDKVKGELFVAGGNFATILFGKKYIQPFNYRFRPTIMDGIELKEKIKKSKHYNVKKDCFIERKIESLKDRKISLQEQIEYVDERIKDLSAKK